MKRKLISLLLVLALLVSVFPTGAMAAEFRAPTRFQTATMVQVNPLYADVLTPRQVEFPQTRADASPAAEGDFVSQAQVASQIREYLKDRTINFTVYLKADVTTTDEIKAITGQVFDDAMVHTGDPVEGDYLRWQYGQWAASMSWSTSGSTSNITIDFEVDYYTSASQEAEMDTAVNNLLKQLNVYNANDYEKICAVYDYICNNVTYDYDNLENDAHVLKYTAYAALMNGTAVCQGYAVLFYRLVLTLDVDSRFIAGIGNGGPHGWNIVELKNLYYNVDSTWDASYAEADMEYEYFLVTDANFDDHERYDEYATREFYNEYPMASSDYVHTEESEPTEPEPTEPAPTEPAPTEPAPTEPAPTEPAPTEPAPTEPAPTEPAPTEPAPTEPAPTEPAPTEPAPTEPAPTEPAPTEPAPTEPEPTDPAPTEPEPTEPAPTEPEPTEPAPTEPEPTDPAPTEPEPTEPAPTEPEPTDPAPTEPEPTEPAPTEPEPTDPAPHEHNYGPWEIVWEASSEKEGLEKRTCACGEEETRVIPRLENPFKDVKKSDYFFEPVLWAVNKGITGGTSANTFSPSASCTRGQIVTFLWAAAGRPEPESSKNPFTDVKETDYFCKAVLWAVENGITSGVSATRFGPNVACTRGQVATFLWASEGRPEPESGKNTFSDVKKTDYFYKAVLWAVENGITSGIGNGKFGPGVTCTRGQIVTFLYKAIAGPVNPETAEPEPTPEPEPELEYDEYVVAACAMDILAMDADTDDSIYLQNVWFTEENEDGYPMVIIEATYYNYNGEKEWLYSTALVSAEDEFDNCAVVYQLTDEYYVGCDTYSYAPYDSLTGFVALDIDQCIDTYNALVSG